ncbi:shikimate kinase [Leptospira vanthielii]|uniref:Shikimate kinase n=1 Tax=Leptospira vanthielii serovar Holland str. Waz Holland = ATCC 700522 TaxID=1218591 RepID=N1W9S0_9LEPT|nr:shikimate kinase [Leptospira vanthielii]EMY70185.1 shikimate kinase [Leptospira vanthielii serovar Holland str. Waz Holland = ATCC 700522]
MNIIFIGARGAGKSKVSRSLSKKTEFPVVSTDSIAVYEAGGIPIPKFVEKSGWKAFRELEYSILQKLQNADGIILDCGGGILFDLDEAGNEVPSKRKLDLLRSIGRIVYLERGLEELIEKVKGDSTRPDLSKETSYRAILEKRLPVYQEAAHFKLNLSKLSKEEAAEHILGWLGFKSK